MVPVAQPKGVTVLGTPLPLKKPRRAHIQNSKSDSPAVLPTAQAKVGPSTIGRPSQDKRARVLVGPLFQGSYQPDNSLMESPLYKDPRLYSGRWSQPE